jgi:hypothetical protein
MMMFARAAPAGSRLLRVAAGNAPGVDVWATRGLDGHVRVVLTNRGSRDQDIKVRVPAVHGAAALERLEAPSVHATSGVTLGGQSFGPATTTGLLAGSSSVVAVKPSSGGYVISLPRTSAAVLTI